MKNKSKLKKIKAAKNNDLQMPTDWFYMHPEDISVRKIYETLSDREQAEIWEAMGVLEIELASGKSMDFEQTKAQFRDEEGMEFLKKHQVVSMFYVSIPAEDAAEAKTLMQQIADVLGGFFCADSADFMPMVKVDSQEE